MTSDYIFENLPDYTFESLTEHAEKIINSEEPYSEQEVRNIRGIILSYAMEEVDFALVESLCEKFIKDSNEDLKWISIICVGHIARVYRRQVNSSLMKEIYKIYKDTTLKHWGASEIALDDIEFFLKIPKPKIPESSRKINRLSEKPGSN